MFAFAITLLVLDLRRPDLSVNDAPHLASALATEWPAYVTYVLSFGVIGIMWINHHALFRLVKTIDRRTLVLNLLLLLAVAAVPFATAVLGRYTAFAPAAVLYGCVLTASSLAFNLLFDRLRRTHAFAPSVPQEVIDRNAVRYRLGFAIYAIGTLAGVWFPVVSVVFFCAVTLYFLLPGGVDKDFQ